MPLAHVFVGNHEFIGRIDSLDEKDWVGGWLLLHDAVKCFYHNTSNGLVMSMQNLKTDNNYDGKVKIKVGGGFFLICLQELGNLGKKYHQALSSLTLPDLKLASPGIRRN